MGTRVGAAAWQPGVGGVGGTHPQDHHDHRDDRQDGQRLQPSDHAGLYPLLDRGLEAFQQRSRQLALDPGPSPLPDRGLEAFRPPREFAGFRREYDGEVRGLDPGPYSWWKCGGHGEGLQQRGHRLMDPDPWPVHFQHRDDSHWERGRQGSEEDQDPCGPRESDGQVFQPRGRPLGPLCPSSPRGRDGRDSWADLDEDWDALRELIPPPPKSLLLRTKACKRLVNARGRPAPRPKLAMRSVSISPPECRCRRQRPRPRLGKPLDILCGDGDAERRPLGLLSLNGQEGRCGPAPPSPGCCRHRSVCISPILPPSARKLGKGCGAKAVVLTKTARTPKRQRERRKSRQIYRPPVAARQDLATSMEPPAESGVQEPAADGGRNPSNLVVAPVTLPSPPRSSPAEATEATIPAGRQRKAARRRRIKGSGAVATTGTSTATGANLRLLTATLTTAALPTASATTDKVFHFKATAETNAAVASGSATSTALDAAANPKKRPAEEDIEVIDLASPEPEPVNKSIPLAVVHPSRPDAKRQRCDVEDYRLGRAVELLVGAGAGLIYRTGRPCRPDWADWTVDPHLPVTDPPRYEALDVHSQEFASIDANFQATCRGKGFRVTRIARVENAQLLADFQEQVKKLERRCGEVAVLRLYHGTPRDNIESIALGNLDKRLAGLGTQHTWWGRGVNFSPISYYASHYGDLGFYRSMLVCDVLVGRTCSVRNPPEAPQLPEKSGLYDTNVKPTGQVVCKFEDEHCYPAYIIDYTAPPRGHRAFTEFENYRPWMVSEYIDSWRQSKGYFFH